MWSTERLQSRSNKLGDYVDTLIISIVDRVDFEMYVYT
jgi:hypothetical protein